MINNYYICDNCSGVTHTEEFKLNADNFTQMNLSSNPLTNMMENQANKTIHICLDCIIEVKAKLEATAFSGIFPVEA